MNVSIEPIFSRSNLLKQRAMSEVFAIWWQFTTRKSKFVDSDVVFLANIKNMTQFAQFLGSATLFLGQLLQVMGGCAITRSLS